MIRSAGPFAETPAAAAWQWQSSEVATLLAEMRTILLALPEAFRDENAELMLALIEQANAEGVKSRAAWDAWKADNRDAMFALSRAIDRARNVAPVLTDNDLLNVAIAVFRDGPVRTPSTINLLALDDAPEPRQSLLF